MFDDHPIPDTTCDAIMKERQEKSKDETTIGGWIRSGNRRKTYYSEVEAIEEQQEIYRIAAASD